MANSEPVESTSNETTDSHASRKNVSPGRPLSAAERQRRYRERLKREKERVERQKAIQREKWRERKRRQRMRQKPRREESKVESSVSEYSNSKGRSTELGTLQLQSPPEHNNASIHSGRSEPTGPVQAHSVGNEADKDMIVIVCRQEEEKTVGKAKVTGTCSDTLCTSNQKQQPKGKLYQASMMDEGFGNSDVEPSSTDSHSRRRPLTSAERRCREKEKLERQKAIQREKWRERKRRQRMRERPLNKKFQAGSCPTECFTGISSTLEHNALPFPQKLSNDSLHRVINEPDGPKLPYDFRMMASGDMSNVVHRQEESRTAHKAAEAISENKLIKKEGELRQSCKIASVCGGLNTPVVKQQSSIGSVSRRRPLTAAERQRNYRERKRKEKELEEQKSRIAADVGFDNKSGLTEYEKGILVNESVVEDEQNNSNMLVDGRSAGIALKALCMGSMPQKRPLTAAERQRKYREKLKMKRKQCMEKQKTSQSEKRHEGKRRYPIRQREVNPCEKKIHIESPAQDTDSSEQKKSSPCRDRLSRCRTESKQLLELGLKNREKQTLQQERKQNSSKKAHCSVGFAICGDKPTRVGAHETLDTGKHMPMNDLGESVSVHVNDSTCPNKIPRSLHDGRVMVPEHGITSHENHFTEAQHDVQRAKSREETKNCCHQKNVKERQNNPSVCINNIAQQSDQTTIKDPSDITREAAQNEDGNKITCTGKFQIGDSAFQKQTAANVLESSDVSLECHRLPIQMQNLAANMIHMAGDEVALKRTKERERKRRYRCKLKENAYLNSLTKSSTSHGHDGVIPIISPVWSMCASTNNLILNGPSFTGLVSRKTPLTAAERQRNYRERKRKKKELEKQMVMKSQNQRNPVHRGKSSPVKLYIVKDKIAFTEETGVGNCNPQLSFPDINGQNGGIPVISDVQNTDNTNRAEAVFDRPPLQQAEYESLSQQLPHSASVQLQFVPEQNFNGFTGASAVERVVHPADIMGMQCMAPPSMDAFPSSSKQMPTQLIYTQDHEATNVLQAKGSRSSCVPMTAAERQRRYRERLKRNPEKFALLKQKRRERCFSSKASHSQQQNERIRSLSIVTSGNRRSHRRQRGRPVFSSAETAEETMHSLVQERGNTGGAGGGSSQSTSVPPALTRQRYGNSRKPLQCNAANKQKDAIGKRSNRNYMTPEQIERCRRKDRERQRRFRAKKRGLLSENYFANSDSKFKESCGVQQQSLTLPNRILHSSHEDKSGNSNRRSMSTDKFLVKGVPDDSAGVSEESKGEFLVLLKEEVDNESSLWMKDIDNVHVTQIACKEEFVVSSGGNIPLLIKPPNIKQEVVPAAEEIAEVIPCDPPHVDYNWADMSPMDSHPGSTRHGSSEEDGIGVVCGSARRKAFLPTRCSNV